MRDKTIRDCHLRAGRGHAVERSTLHYYILRMWVLVFVLDLLNVVYALLIMIAARVSAQWIFTRGPLCVRRKVFIGEDSPRLLLSVKDFFEWYEFNFVNVRIGFECFDLYGCEEWKGIGEVFVLYRLLNSWWNCNELSTLI